jgi:hypothetical protein
MRSRELRGPVRRTRTAAVGLTASTSALLRAKVPKKRRIATRTMAPARQSDFRRPASSRPIMPRSRSSDDLWRGESELSFTLHSRYAGCYVSGVRQNSPLLFCNARMRDPVSTRVCRLSRALDPGWTVDAGRCPGCALLFTTVSYAMLRIENFHGTEVVLVTATNVNT